VEQDVSRGANGGKLRPIDAPGNPRDPGAECIRQTVRLQPRARAGRERAERELERRRERDAVVRRAAFRVVPHFPADCLGKTAPTFAWARAVQLPSRLGKGKTKGGGMIGVAVTAVVTGLLAGLVASVSMGLFAAAIILLLECIARAAR